ncbi:unnamed protein product [Protopolystoma xenopodis]|uniref:Uncharacterized protein n=1 Tax=Protopolystoma xenopodis TaxID=117903 RepID=A0A448WML5_9PLAT|nr:unnamed protein product [Protopolystoma xenopodis]
MFVCTLACMLANGRGFGLVRIQQTPANGVHGTQDDNLFVRTARVCSGDGGCWRMNCLQHVAQIGSGRREGQQYGGREMLASRPEA